MKRLTIKEITELCKKLKGVSRLESYEIGRAAGVESTKAIDLFRSVLGYTRERPKWLTKAEKEEIKDAVKAGVSPLKIAKERGLAASTIYSFLRRDNIEFNKHDFWTERKIMVVCQAIKEGYERDEERAAKIGIKLAAFRSMKQRIKTRTHVKKWEPLLDRMGV